MIKQHCCCCCCHVDTMKYNNIINKCMRWAVRVHVETFKEGVSLYSRIKYNITKKPIEYYVVMEALK